MIAAGNYHHLHCYPHHNRPRHHHAGACPHRHRHYNSGIRHIHESVFLFAAEGLANLVTQVWQMLLMMMITMMSVMMIMMMSTICDNGVGDDFQLREGIKKKMSLLVVFYY